MKKIIIALVVIVAIVLIVPFVGNKIVQGEIEKNLEMLTSSGIKIQERTEENFYFKTKNHLKMFIEEGDKFVLWMNKFSANQLPTYSADFFEGAIVGVDLEYWNFPISDSVAVSFYPLEMPNEIEHALLDENEVLGVFLQNFLKKKGLLYHLNFHITRGGFDGYVKDIKETLDLDNGSKVAITMEGVTYKGDGPIVAPTKLSSKLDILRVQGEKDNDGSVVIEIKNITTDATFESNISYQSSLEAKTLSFDLKEKWQAFAFNGNDFSVSVDAKISGVKANGSIQTSLEGLELTQGQEAIQIKKFNYSLHISEVDKNSYETLQTLIQQAQNNLSQVDETALEKGIIELVSKGIVVELKDLSVKSLSIKNQDLKGISLKAKIIVNPIQQTLYDVHDMTVAVRENATVATTLTISKEMFDFITAQVPFGSMAIAYAKDDGNNYVFEAKYENNNFSINGNPL